MCSNLLTSTQNVCPSQWVDWGCDGTAPIQTAGVPWWMFPRRIGNKTKFFFLFFFSFFFFFQTSLSMGNFPRTTPLLFHRDVCPLRTLWVVFLKAKGRGKEKKKGEKKILWYTRGDWTTIKFTTKWDEESNQHYNIFQPYYVYVCAICLLESNQS